MHLQILPTVTLADWDSRSALLAKLDDSKTYGRRYSLPYKVNTKYGDEEVWSGNGNMWESKANKDKEKVGKLSLPDIVVPTGVQILNKKTEMRLMKVINLNN